MLNTKLETNFLYMYGFILSEELQKSEVPSILGINQKETTTIKFQDLAAVVTSVNSELFSQKQIDLQLKDADWLKEKAFHHHEVIFMLHGHFTILPMPFCTIFQNKDNLKTILIDQYDVILQKLISLKNKQEWNVKMFCNRDKALAYIIHENPAVVELKEKLTSMPKGKQFIMKKKLERLISTELEIEQSKWWLQMNEQLSALVVEPNLRKNWGKEITERKEDMIVNGDFLIEKDKTVQFLEKIEEIEKSFAETGCTLHVTGPWPPYHFSKIDKENS
ncbi:GvpL/GvpF family gas vesicle protein [Bacillus salipaludis]|uniref:GvpL/GvpF family gas vesicle protein n=1 Tax=Bacillus salipaludis TaxID=2547811 RepID=UPI002E21A67E|nr:GvpL/GvpF family gas vesicle protein [Bacillus salipaludis]